MPRVGAQRPRLLHLPDGVVSTDVGRDAVEFAASIGIELDDWQSWLVEQLLAERADGSLAAATAVVLVSRQNGKNVVLAAVEMYGLCVVGLRRQVHSAHRGDTAAEHMKYLRDLIQADPTLDAEQAGYLMVYESNGKERIVNTETRGELSFNTRSRSTKRGASPQRIVLDEAMILDESSLQALVPSLAAQSMDVETSPQIIVTSSAPLPDSVVLHRLRAAALAGSARTLLADWGCPIGTDPDDRDAWYASNPGLGIRISEEWVTEERSTMLTEDAFLVERLGVVFPPPVNNRERVISEPDWLANVTDDDAGVPAGFGLDVSPDRATACIGAASADGHIGIVDHRPGLGLGWVRDRVAELRERRPGVPWVVDGRSAANGLVDMRDDVDQTLGAREMAAACGALYDSVLEHRVRYRSQSALEDAVGSAVRRVLGDAWAWDRRESGGDITPLVAVTLAWQAASAVRPVLLFSY